MNTTFPTRLLLIAIFCLSCVISSSAQKEVKEFPKPMIMTEEELKRMENERNQNEEFQKKQDAGAKKYRISEYPDVLLNDIFKFGFLIVSLVGIAICLFKRKRKGLEYYFPIAILLCTYLSHCLLYSKGGDFSDCFFAGLKEAIISIILSVIFISVFVNVHLKKARLNKQQILFTIIVSLLLTALVAYILTSNITISLYDNATGRSNFLMYPWNWLSFLIINAYLYYQLKVINSNLINTFSGNKVS